MGSYKSNDKFAKLHDELHPQLMKVIDLFDKKYSDDNRRFLVVGASLMTMLEACIKTCYIYENHTADEVRTMLKKFNKKVVQDLIKGNIL